MKLFLLAAAAVIAAPALAQSGSMSGSMPQSGTSTPDSATPATPADQTPSATDSSMAPATTAPAQGTMPMGTTGDPVGGYQPSAPPLSGPATAGQTPVFRAAPSPSEAYPAPAPMASYPICRPGQFDKCMQGPHSTHSRQVRGRPSR